jgi:hypothetical protein
MMELATLLHQAEAASASVRIERRDSIAAYGARAIDAVSPWLKSPRLAAFAVRVIERVGVGGEPVLASKVLRSARSVVPAYVRADVDWALDHIKTQGRLALPSPRPRAVPHPRSVVSSGPRGRAR